MIKRPKAKISIPSNSPALRKELEKTLRKKHTSVEFRFVESDIDSACRILETDNFDGPALWESIQMDLKRIERQYS